MDAVLRARAVVEHDGDRAGPWHRKVVFGGCLGSAQKRVAERKFTVYECCNGPPVYDTHAAYSLANYYVTVADYDRAAVEAVRGAVGPDIDIMADGSMRYDATTARVTTGVAAGHRWLG